MASLADLGTIANDSRFQSRCMQAALDAAINVMAEDPGTASHLKRAQYAEAIINGAVNPVSIARAVLSNSTIAGESDVTQILTTDAIPDSDIQFAVNSVFNALADVAT